MKRTVAASLCDLTERLMAEGAETTGGFLGGEYGYGAHFDNDTFSMHPYCWCEQDDCDYCHICLCPEDAWTYKVGGTEATFDQWLAAPADNRSIITIEEKKCERCKTGSRRTPNFLHKPTGTSIWWYKYIGRSMEMDIKGDWRKIILECFDSLDSALAAVGDDPSDHQGNDARG